MICSHDPTYIRWTQWIFLRFFEAGLAYRDSAPVNWCPGCRTVLANEQVLPDGTCERSSDPVEHRELAQWFFRITAYAQRLLDDTAGIDWPERVKNMQRNWIGRSEGTELGLPIADAEGRPRHDVPPVQVFTTRPDTGFGITYAVLSPEHPRVDELTAPSRRAAVEEFRRSVATQSEMERLSTEGLLDKRGVACGTSLINPFTGRPVPLYLADYVLMTYGTGAIMGVPGEDQRDWEFAVAHGLPIVRTVQPPEGWDGEAYSGEGPSINSEWMDGLAVADAIERAADWLEAEGLGQRKVNYRLRDWLVSRQRFWGCPDPHGALRGMRLPARAGVGPADPAARRRGLPAHRAVTAQRPRRVPGGLLPGLRGTGAARDRHHGHLRGLVVVLPALRRSRQRRGAVLPGGGGALAARGPVHRRHRARHPAPHVRPLLHQGPGRHRRGAGGTQRAVRPAVHPGHDPPRRRQDVQEQGEPRGARGDPGPPGRRCPAPGAPAGEAAARTTWTGRTSGSTGVPSSWAASGAW